MPLSKYRDKRDFAKTREPYGKKTKLLKAPIFVVQKHGARHLHYDLRLEIDGVLKSWAVPKGPSLDPTVKRLAVQVEDHPLEYSQFEGVISPGQYGAGAVMIWDKGTWKNEDLAKHLEKGELTFSLKGKKLKGKWKLIQIKKNPKSWLLIKVNDKYAIPENEYDITEEERSVVSRKTLSEIKENLKKTMLPIANIGSKVSKVPEKINPQLATLVDKAPSGKEWLHEIKFDGYRLLCFIDDTVKFVTRGQKDWTSKFGKLATEIEKLKGLEGTVMDGEVVALDKNNHFSFQTLQYALHQDKSIPLIYYVFDIIYYKGHDLSGIELLKRKKLLKKVLGNLDTDLVHYSDHVIGNGQKVYEKACQMSLEGIISKNIHSTYIQRRGKNWLKVKCSQRQVFIVGGATKPKGGRGYFGSLLLGYYDKNKVLHYCGHVGTGFDDKSLKEIYHLLNHYKAQKSPFADLPAEKNLLFWVRPKITVEVEFLEWTKGNLLRHPSFKFPLSSPDKILYPTSNITKQDIANYYEHVAEWILPYIINRPLTLLRCPKGVDGKCFYQRHLNQTETEKYLTIKSKADLLQLVQMDVLEIHPWNARVDKIEKPDLMIFDLDPGEGVLWKNVVKAAFRIKEELENINLTSFVKTTGGKGLHIVIPLQRRVTWEDIFQFSKVFAQYMVQKYPSEYIDVMAKSKRENKIFIDYLRNHRGATAIAPYSTRARKGSGASVATPLSWEELTPKIKPDATTIQNLPQRLKTLKKDPWEGFFEVKQKLPLKK